MNDPQNFGQILLDLWNGGWLDRTVLFAVPVLIVAFVTALAFDA